MSMIELPTTTREAREGGEESASFAVYLLRCDLTDACQVHLAQAGILDNLSII